MIDKMRLQAWLQLPDATRLTIFNETARRLGLPATAVEKDWWVVHTLALVFSMECAPALIFKGGTSLSKGWGLIQRFSEDIDLAIDREYLGYPGDLNRQTINKLRKKSYEFMTKTFLQELTTKFTEAGFTGIKVDYQYTGQSDQDPLIVGIYYPKLTEPNTYQKRDIELEVGCRSLREPVTDRTFTTMVAEQFNNRPFTDAPVTIPVVNPERTFLEKIFLLHEEFQKPADKIRVNRLSRHLYDIDKLSHAGFADLALNDTGLYQTIVDHRRRFTSIAGVDYENHSPDKLAFVPPAHLLRDWEADYRQMRENMIYGNPITFKELIQNLSTLQTRINNNTLVTELEITAFQQTEVGEIPSDWEVKTLQYLSNRIGDGIHTTPKYSDSGDYYFVNGNNLKNGRVIIAEDTKRVSSEEFFTHQRGLDNSTILLSINGTIGNISLYNKENIILGKSAAYISLNNKANRHFIYYIIQAEFIKNYFYDELTGSTIKNLGLSSIRNTPIPLPPTLTEQTAIATALTDADALIAQLEKLIAKKKAIKQGAMQELLKPKEGWEEKTLGEVATLKARIGWQGLTTAEYRKSGKFYLITGTEFKNGFIDWDSCFYVDEERYKQDRNIQVRELDVLVTKDGTIGKIALIKNEPKPATLNSGVFVIRPVGGAFSPEFLYYLLLSEVFKLFLSQLSAGSTINHLYQKDFVGFKFLTPKSIEEQTNIAQILSDMDAEIEKLEQRLAKQKMLKQGMMQVLLTGKIRLV